MITHGIGMIQQEQSPHSAHDVLTVSGLRIELILLVDDEGNSALTGEDS